MHLSKYCILLLIISQLLFKYYKSDAQVRVLFADSLEHKAEIFKVKVGKSQDYAPIFKMNFENILIGKMSIANVDIANEKIIIEEKRTKFLPTFLYQLLFNSEDYKQAKIISEGEQKLTYDIFEDGDKLVSIDAHRQSNRKLQNQITIHNGITITDNVSDTSYVEAKVIIDNGENAYNVDLLFLDNDYKGTIINGLDTFYIAKTSISKKYKAHGAEIRHLSKVIAGMQHSWGPTYMLVDKSKESNTRKMLYSVLTLILYYCDNRG